MKILNQNLNLNEWEFEYQQRDFHPILMADQWSRSLYYNFKQEINLPVSKLDYLLTGLCKGYIKKKQKAKIILELRKAIQTEKYLNYLLKTTQQRVKEFENISKKINNKLNKEKINFEKLADLWQEFNDVFMKVIPWFFIPWYVTEYNLITDRVKDKLIKYRNKIEKITDFNDALMVLIFPIKKVLFQKEQDDFYKIVESARNKKNFENNKHFLKQARNYLKKYAWMKTFLFLPIEPLTLKELIKRVKTAIEKGTLKEYHLQKLQQNKNKRLANKLSKIIEKDKPLLNQIKWAQKFGWLLTWSVEQVFIFTADLLPFYKLIAKHLNIKYSQWGLLTHKEIIHGLKGKKRLSNQELAKREAGYIFLIQKGKAVMIFGQQARKLSKMVDEKVGAVKGKIDNIKGQPVSPGIVQGKVKIIMMANKANKIKDGDILVCSMTSPDYVPAMKRAKAIITDEGGLLCHATIVSRELNKPCIVGTKNASKILKDGDIVLVNANKGIVKILK